MAGRINGCARFFDGKLLTSVGDPTRGLTLTLNRPAVVSDFCTRIIQKSNNFSTNRPKNLPFANELTRLIIKVGGISRLTGGRRSPVLTMYWSDLHHAYPKWRYLSQTNRTQYYQHALSQKCGQSELKPMAFTMRLSPELAKAVIENNGAGYLLERLRLKLKRSLRRSPEMWLMIEATTKERDSNGKGRPKTAVSWSEGLLHVHGAIGLRHDEVSEMKRVVRELNASSNTTFLNNELRFEKTYDDVGWVEYCCKHSFINDCFLAGTQRYSRSNSLSADAEQLYEHDRMLFKAALKSKSLMTN